MRTPFARIAGLFGRRRRDAHLDEEIRSHLDLLAADYERRGLSPDEARHAARRAFGAIEPMKEQYRDRLGLPWLDDLARDVRHGVRAMWRSPGFTLACTVMLTLGIGLNLACFQLLNVTTLQPLAVTDPDTLVRFYRRGPQGSISTVSYRAATFIAAHQDVLSAVLTESFMDVVWQDDPSDRQRAAFVSTNWFRDLGYDAGRGRVFTPDDDRPDAESVVVLSHAFWQGRLGGDPDVIGSVVRVNEQPVMVIGVAPADFPGLQLRPVQLWLPAEQVDRFYPVLAVTTSSRSSTAMYGRLRDGVSFEAAVQGLRPALAELAARQPDAFSANEWLEPYSARVRFESPRERRQRMQLALAGGALTMLVLLIACANLSNLVLSRAGERSREVAIQTALGARRWRVMRQHMTETLVLASVGAAGGLLVANGAASAMAAMLQLPVFLDFSIDWRTMIAALAIALFAMVAIGVYPAWRASQPGLATSLKDGGQQTSSSLERARFRQVLITVQIAGTCLLLVLAGAMLQNLRRALVESPGFVFDRVAVLDPSLRRYGLDDAAAQEYWDRLTSAIRAFPETDAVALVSHPPLGRNLQQSVYPETGSLQVTTVEVEPGFFTMMGIPLLRGRTFAAGDDPEQTVIISRRLALAMYRSLDVLGLAFPRIPSKYAPGSMRTIVGVAEDARLIRFTADDGAEQYRPVNPRQPQFLSLLASARTDAGRLIRPMRDAARTVDDRVLVDVRVMSAGLEARLTPSESGAPLRVCSRSWRCRSHASAPLLSSRTPQRGVREKSAFA